MRRYSHKREVGGEPRSEAAPATHTEPGTPTAPEAVAPVGSLFERFVVAAHIPADHLLRVRVGDGVFTADELSRKFRIKQQRLRMLVNTGAIVRV